MANYIKKELETFEYDKRYPTLIEHRWCKMRDDKKYDKFIKDKADNAMPKISRVQSDPETTGQLGTML